jgi:hypothetical protein
MSEFVSALANHTVGQGELSFGAALDAHLMAFAAEQSRVMDERIDFAEWVRGLGLETNER